MCCIKVWPKGKVVFPDFFLNRTEDLWSDLIVKHYDSITFDGLWIVSAYAIQSTNSVSRVIVVNVVL